MTFTPKGRAFGPIDRNTCVSAGHERWRNWCRSKSNSPTGFRNWLYHRGITVDWHTANRWWNGESLPGTSRLIELTAAGLACAADQIFEPAFLFGSQEVRRALVAEKRAEAARLEREARDLETIDCLSRRHTGVER